MCCYETAVCFVHFDSMGGYYCCSGSDEGGVAAAAAAAAAVVAAAEEVSCKRPTLGGAI